MNSASLKKTIDCRGENVQGYLQTNSECLQVEESKKEWNIKKKWILK